MTQIIFDGGIFCLMLIIAFACIAFYRKIGALMLVVPIMVFLVGGLIILTGEDVAFYKTSNPTNMTIITVNGTHTSTTTFHNIAPANETDYLVGNSQFQISGIGQLWMGYSLILLSLVFGVVFLDQVWKGNLVTGNM